MSFLAFLICAWHAVYYFRTAWSHVQTEAGSAIFALAVALLHALAAFTLLPFIGV